MAGMAKLRLPGQGGISWKNWAGNQRCSPLVIERPLTEAHLQSIVKKAASGGHKIRAVGSGHSFTAIACSDEILVSLEHLNMVRYIDTKNSLITVQAGIELGHLNNRLAKAGLAMTNLGDIAYQSLAGAVSTGTHGTGVDFTGIAGQIRRLRLVTATGEIVDCSADENAELFRVARVGLGVFGIISEITLAVEPAFNLHAVEGPHPLNEVLDNWLDDVADNDHYEFFWIPGSDAAMTKRNHRTSDAANPQPKVKHFVNKILAENIGFGAMAKLASLWPSLIPKFRKVLIDSVGAADFTDQSHRVFASPRWVKFVEMEYSVALEDVPEILRRIDEAVRDAGLDLLFPVEVRATAGDDIPLSTAFGRASGYIAVHRVKGIDYQPYFELVEAIMDEFDGRPHWGKVHFQTAATLAGRYPEWDIFQTVRAQYDPTNMFSNDYVDRVLGVTR
jgi:FAD-linked oxidoreductase